MKNKPVIIIGAGITGLSTAWYLEKKGFTNITILEASNRTGGKIETRHEDGFLVESGPDSFIVTKPFALDLIHELGLEDQLISPKTNRFFILKDKKLISSPKGLNMMVPTDLFAFLESRFFSWPAKHRILEECNVPANLSEEDESFGDFIARRFGQEMLEMYAGPLFTGIYATPANELSLNATFPMLKKMEMSYGSISRAIKKQAKPAGPGSRSTFMGLKNGMSNLPDALISKLKHTRILTDTKLVKISIDKELNAVKNPGSKIYVLETDKIEKFSALNLVVSLPAAVTGGLIKDISPGAAKILDSFTSSSSRIVTLAYPKEYVADPLLATGYVSAANEKTQVTAGTWLSSKWEGRAPEGYVLLRCFMGKNRESLSFTNDELIQTAHMEMSCLLGIACPPEYYWVQRWDNALPQYKTGHPDKVTALKKAIEPFDGLQLTGSYLYGVGLPDCIRQGKEAAERVMESLVKVS